MILKFFFSILLLTLVSCTSTPTKESKSSEAVESNAEEDDYETDTESKPVRTQMSAKVKSMASKLYKIDLSFEKVMNAFVRATTAVPNNYSIYRYDVEYSLFDSSGKINGQVDVLSKKGDKYFTAESKSKSRTRKHFYAGLRTKKGFCGACFFEMDQIHFMIGTAHYEKPGPSSAFYSTSLRFLKGPKKKTLVIVGGGNKLKSAYRVTGVTFKKALLEVLYTSPDGLQNKVVVKLNKTLDTEAFRRPKGKKEFQMLARYFGGTPSPFSVKK